MSDSPRLALPYIVASQAQKEITHNDALNDLDSLAQISVINKTTATPPGSPDEGNSYIIASSPTGAWSGQAGKIASYYSGWRIKTPQEGWSAWVQDEDQFYVFDGSAWTGVSGGSTTSFSAGSASSPGWPVTGDTDTGIFEPAANTLSIAAGGVEAVRFNTAASAVNYPTLTPAAASGAVVLGSAGSDTNIPITLTPKGSGAITLSNAATAASTLGVTGNFAVNTNKFNVTASSGNTTVAGTLGVTGAITGSNLSGANTGDQTITLTGNVTGSGTGSFATTIANSAVTNAMLAGSIAASKLVGTDITSVGTITSGAWNGTAINLSSYASGTLPAAQLPALSGDVSSSAGSASVTVAKINGATLGTATATSGNLLIGSGTQWATQAVSGDVTINSSGVTAIGSGKVTNAMLAGSIAASKLVGTDITSVGTITTGVWNAGAVTSSGAVIGANHKTAYCNGFLPTWAYPSGSYWAYSPFVQGFADGSAVDDDVLYALPLVIGAPVTIDNLYIRTTSGNAGNGSSVKAAIYDSDATTGKPTNRLATATTGVSTAGASSSITIALDSPVTLNPGFYWAVTLHTHTTTAATFRVQSTANGMGWIGASSVANVFASSPRIGYTGSQSYASHPPSSFGTATSTDSPSKLACIAFHVQ